MNSEKITDNESKYFVPGSNLSKPKVRNYVYQELASREHKKAFGQFSSSVTQRVETLDPVKIYFDAQEQLISGSHSIDFDKGDILIKQSGMYLIIAAPQVGKSCFLTCGNTPHWIDFWLRINNNDLENSAVRRSLVDNFQKDVIPINVVTPLHAGDKLNIMMAAETKDEGMGIESIEPNGEPVIPSIIATLIQLD
ncbi:MAG TPA: hypothetical protein VIS47_00185 [Nitrosopumilus sp.]